MSEWLTDGPDSTAALLREWNSRRHGIVRGASYVLSDPENQVAGVLLMRLTQPLTEVQEQKLVDTLTDSEMSDQDRLTNLAALRTVLTAARVEGGIKAPAALATLPDRQWVFTIEATLSCDTIGVPE